MGYATGQFGKNHLGDKNEFLPTVHGFDEFFGYLYHLDAMEDPAHPDYPQELLNTVGPRNMVHSYATNVDDATVDPRWGKVGKQKIEDAGTLYPKRMETVDDEIRDLALKFIDKAKADNKPFFLWLNPTRMHIVTHLSPKYEALRNSKNGWTIHEAGMAQLDDDVGIVMKKLKDMGVDDNTIVVFTTDNGTEVFTWPDGGQTPFAQSKGTVFEGGFRVPGMIRWPGKVPAGKVENGIISGLDWFPTFLAAAGNPNIVEELKKGKQIGDTTYKCHLDGYNQMDMITGKGPSNRHEIWYFGESELGAVRIDDYKYRFIDQPGGWLGEKTKPDVPYLINLRLDPFERTGWPNSGTKEGAQQYFDWFKYEFWRFVFVQQQVEKLAMTAIEFPPMQKGASFNLDAVKAKIEAARSGNGQVGSSSTSMAGGRPAARLTSATGADLAAPISTNGRNRSVKPIARFPRIDRRILLSSLAMLPVLSDLVRSTARSRKRQRDPLPSWNEGATKTAILDFVARVTTQGGPDFVPAEQRIATFDNDGTLWVEQPMYIQLAFALDRVKALAPHASGMEDQAAVRGGARRRPEGAGRVRRKGIGRDHRRHACRHDDGGVREDRHRLDRDRARSAASSGPIPNWSTSRCWNCWPICAPTASRPSSSPAAASSSCGRGPSGSTAYRPSRSSARRSRLDSRCRTARRCCSGCPTSISSTTRPASRSASTSTSAAVRSPPSAIPTAISRCCNGRRSAPAASASA